MSRIRYTAIDGPVVYNVEELSRNCRGRTNAPECQFVVSDRSYHAPRPRTLRGRRLMATFRVPGAVLLASLSCVVAAACGGSSATSSPAPVLQKAAANSGDGQSGFAGSALAESVAGPGDAERRAAAGRHRRLARRRRRRVGRAGDLGHRCDGDRHDDVDPGFDGGGPDGDRHAARRDRFAGDVHGDGGGGAGPRSRRPRRRAATGRAAPWATRSANPLRVLVTLSGAPQQGVSVTWAAAGTGAAVTPPTSVTDATGIATTTWTLGQTAGTPERDGHAGRGEPARRSRSARRRPRGPRRRLALASGDNQTGAPNAALRRRR